MQRKESSTETEVLSRSKDREQKKVKGVSRKVSFLASNTIENLNKADIGQGAIAFSNREVLANTVMFWRSIRHVSAG